MKVKGSHATSLGFNGVFSSNIIIVGHNQYVCNRRFPKMLLLHALEQRTCTLPDHGCRRQVIKCFSFWVVWDFFLFEVPGLLHIKSCTLKTLSIISQAQRRCPVFWRRRFLELKLVLIWRRPAVCCPSVTVSLVCTGWGMFRPKRWWSSPPVWRCVSKGSRRPDDWCSASCTRYTWDLALIGSSCILL